MLALETAILHSVDHESGEQGEYAFQVDDEAAVSKHTELTIGPSVRFIAP